jgi:hypothetical protein
VVVTFLRAVDVSTNADVVAPAEGGGLEDFEPIVPRKPIW